jgi:hypothetical protein
VKETTKDVMNETQIFKSDIKNIIFKEVETISSQIRGESNKTIDEFHTSRIKIDHELSQKVKKSDLINLKNELSLMLEPKVEDSEVQKALNNLQTDLANRLINTKIEIQGSLTTSLENIKHQLLKKCNVDEVNEMLG